MKQWLLLTIATFFSTIAPAQIILTNEDFPRAGDTLITAVDNLPSGIPITPPGPDQSWDFTTLQSPFSRRIVIKPAAKGRQADAFPGATQVIQLSENLEAYYQVTENTYELIGRYGDDPLNLGLSLVTHYRPTAIERYGPMEYEDKFEDDHAFMFAFAAEDLPDGVFSDLPITPDSLRIRVDVQRQGAVDAWGSLIVPGGIYDVLREKRFETRNARLEAKVGPLPWADVTALLPNSKRLGRIRHYSYRYLSNETKAPVAVITMDANDDEPVRVEYKANRQMTRVQDITQLKPGVYAYPNPAIVTVRFEFSNLEPGAYKLTIYNILAVEEWKETYYINGNHTEKVDISGLRKGTYLYSLTNEEGKTMSTRRLVVVRP